MRFLDNLLSQLNVGYYGYYENLQLKKLLHASKFPEMKEFFFLEK